MAEQPRIRRAEPADYDRIVAVMDEWWGRPVAVGLSRLFLDHFDGTSFVAETGGRDGAAGAPAAGVPAPGVPAAGAPAVLAGFLVGFLSQSCADEAYIHYMAVGPQFRRAGLARTLYERFFALARASGRTTVRAITSPDNAASIAFHSAMGFAVSGPVEGYDGPGRDRVLFVRSLV